MSASSFGTPKTFRVPQNTTCYVRLNINFRHRKLFKLRTFLVTKTYWEVLLIINIVCLVINKQTLSQYWLYSLLIVLRLETMQAVIQSLSHSLCIIWNEAVLLMFLFYHAICRQLMIQNVRVVECIVFYLYLASNI